MQISLREYFGQNTEEVIETWGYLYEELLNSSRLATVSVAENVECFRETRNVYKVLVEKPEGMRFLERCKILRENNIRALN